MGLDYIWVGLFGLLIGLAELLSRYRDAPFSALKTMPAWVYIGLNITAAVGALEMLRVFEVDFGLATNTQKLRWAQVLAAGFGAMVLFRSSILVFRAGDQDVSVGPASVLQILFSTLDREVDRHRAKKRAEAVKKIMEGISFSKASNPLPLVAIALMQNLPREEQDRIVSKIKGLNEDDKIPAYAKAIALGLTIIDFVGENVLDSTVRLIKGEIIEQEDALLTATQKALMEQSPLVEPNKEESEVDRLLNALAEMLRKQSPQDQARSKPSREDVLAETPPTDSNAKTVV